MPDPRAACVKRTAPQVVACRTDGWWVCGTNGTSQIAPRIVGRIDDGLPEVAHA